MITPTRRQLLLASSLALAAGCSRPNPRRASSLSVACGEDGGFYLEFGRLLAAELVAAGVVGSAKAVATRGSSDNLDRLKAREVTLALSLIDVAAGGTPSNALGRVYENYLHCAVRRDGPVRTVQDLAGRAVSLGAAGSGVVLTSGRVLSAARLAAPVRERHLDLSEALAALEAGEVDAMMWSGGVPTRGLAELDARIGLRMLDLAEVIPGLRAAFGSLYESVLIPPGAYNAPGPVGTVGVANLLLCAADLSDPVAAGIVDVLVRRAPALVPASALGAQFLDPSTLVGTSPVPLHPGAVRRYRELHG